MTAIALIGVTVLDLLFGDPFCLPHPVRWIGALVSWLESILYPNIRSNRKEYLHGFLLCILVIFICSGFCGIIIYFAYMTSPTIGVIAGITTGFYCLSGRSLADEAMNVYKNLQNGNIYASRQALSMIVGRDTVNMNEKQIICATIETVAENITDGIVSPLFYLALGGPVAAIAFKAVSTMDSMIGYKNDRYRYFGTLAARLDDVLNFIPARLTGFVLIPLSSLLLRKRWQDSIRIVFRDRLKHDSPNSAHGEAAMAGALGIQLGGGAFYNGVFESRPLLGDNCREPVINDIRAASNIAITVLSVMTLGVCVIKIIMKEGKLFFQSN